MKPVGLRLPLLLAALSTLGAQRGGASETDRMMEVAKKRFSADFWKHEPTKAYGTTWLRSPLRASSGFSRTRKNLEQQFAKLTQDSEKIVDRLKRDALAHPEDAARLFKWGYGAFLKAGLDAQQGKAFWAGFDRRRELSVLEWCLAAIDSSEDYEYARLRFLIEAGNRYRPDLLAFGGRLLQRKPDDAPVKRTVGYVLGTSRNASDLQKASLIADELLKIAPDRLSYIALKQYVYETRWLALGNRSEDAEKGIEWARRYLDAAPAGSPNRSGFERSIRMMSSSAAGSVKRKPGGP